MSSSCRPTRAPAARRRRDRRLALASRRHARAWSTHTAHSVRCFNTRLAKKRPTPRRNPRRPSLSVSQRSSGSTCQRRRRLVSSSRRRRRRRRRELVSSRAEEHHLDGRAGVRHAAERLRVVVPQLALYDQLQVGSRSTSGASLAFTAPIFSDGSHSSVCSSSRGPRPRACWGSSAPPRPRHEARSAVQWLCRGRPRQLIWFAGWAFAGARERGPTQPPSSGKLHQCSRSRSPPFTSTHTRRLLIRARLLASCSARPRRPRRNWTRRARLRPAAALSRASS